VFWREEPAGRPRLDHPVRDPGADELPTGNSTPLELGDLPDPLIRAPSDSQKLYLSEDPDRPFTSTVRHGLRR
jgi:hypothetical protein